MIEMTSSGICIVASWTTGLRHVRRADDLVGQQQVHHPDAGGAGFFAGLGDLVGRCEAEVHQYVRQIIVFFCHGLPFRSWFA
jgi:hypothetical protein